AKPFGIFFGDEEFFIRRSMSLRNLALGLPIHSADLIYAFDEVGQTSYLYVLAWLQVLIGPAPYGVHLVGAALYLAAAVLRFGMAASLTRPRALIAAAVLTPIVLGAALSRPFVQVQAYRAVQRAAEQQQGHIHTAGYAYKTLDDRFYYSVRDIDNMRFFEAAR